MARILIIDDESELLEVSALALEAAGNLVLALDGGARAVEAAQSFGPEVIVIDWVMADGPAPAVVAALRRAGFGHVPVVLMTALAEGEVLARSIGARALLRKPFGVDQLCRAVDSLAPEPPSAPA